MISNEIRTIFLFGKYLWMDPQDYVYEFQNIYVTQSKTLYHKRIHAKPLHLFVQFLHLLNNSNQNFEELLEFMIIQFVNLPTKYWE